jgi:uncharacterized protein involved in exopolysaccharide biosynthesis
VNPPPANQAPSDADDIQLIDFQALLNWGGFVVHSMRRRRRLALLAFLSGLLATVTVWVVLPRTYQVEAQLLAQRNTVMPALGNPGRKVPLEADSPTRGAAEAVMRRDNLLSLMKQTDLLNRWHQTRPRLLRFKDRVMNFIGGPPSEEDQTDAMVGFLERRLTVVTGEATVTISIDWPEPQLAYRLVDTALQNFLEQRRAVEVSTIAETISILEGHAASLREAIDGAMDDLKRARDPASARAPGGSGSPPAAPKRDPAQEALRAELAEVRLMLQAKRRAITQLEEFRRHRLAELQAELDQQRAVYADAHPNVVKLEQSISALQEDSPQLIALRKDESDLMADGAKLAGTHLETSPSRPAPGELGPGRRSDSDELGREYARTRLRFAMEKYDGLMERIDSARIELDTARAAFKYRYSVIRPPAFPKRPLKPKLPIIFGGGVLASILLALLVATLADARSGRVLESWQVEKLLGLPVLGKVPRPVK